MDEVFKALADPSRRLLLDSLNARNGQTLRELCAGLDLARQSVSKHLAVLEQAGLVTPVWRGREKLHYLNAAPILEISERWINRYDRARVEALADLKQALEDTPMNTAAPSAPAGTTLDRPDFVYTSYIRTRPEQLWHALTEPAFTRRYWRGMTFVSDWKPGSQVTVTRTDGSICDDPEQVVLESDPFRRLAYTWFDVTGGCDSAGGGAPEPRSKVAFDLEDLGNQVKLTVTHDGFAPGSRVLSAISGGWPAVLSDLKTLLETGELAD